MSRRADFYLYVGDTAPEIKSDLKRRNDDGDVVVQELTVEDTVTFWLNNATTGVRLVDTEADITDGGVGEVTYFWEDGDTDVAGLYEARWNVVFEDGTIRTFPNPDPILVRIVE